MEPIGLVHSRRLDLDCVWGMKRYVLVALGLSVIGCFNGTRLASRGSKSEPSVETMELPNRLRVAVQHREQGTTAVLLTIHTGYAADPIGKEGLAHLVEHLVCGSGAEQGIEWIDAARNLGAVQVNAFTGPDQTVYHAVVPSGQLPELLRGFRRLVSDPLAKVDESLFTREQHVVKSEGWLRDDEGVPAAVWAGLGEMLFPTTHPYSHSEFGSAASVNTIGFDDVRSFVGEHYRPGNVSLALVGPVDAESRATILEFGNLRDLNQLTTVGGLAPGNHSQPITANWAKTNPEGPRLKQLDGNDDARLWFAWALPPDARHLDRYAHIIANVGRERLQFPFSDQGHPGVKDIRLTAIPGERATILLGSVRLVDGASADGVLSWVNAQVRRGLLDEIQLRKDKLFYNIDPIDASLGLARASVQAGLDNPLAKAQAITHAMYHDLDANQFLQELDELGTADPDAIRAYATTWLTSERIRGIHIVKNGRTGAPQVEPSPGQVHTGEHTKVTSAQVTAAQLERISSPPSTSKLTTGTLPNGLTYALLDWPGARSSVVYLAHDRGTADAASPAIARAMQLSLARITWLEVGPKGVDFRRNWDADSSYVVAWSGEQTVTELAKLVVQRTRDETPGWPTYAGDTPEEPRIMSPKYAESYAVLLRDHPWAESLGWVDVSNVTADEVQNHWLDVFNPKRSILIAVGEVADPRVQHAILETAGTLRATAAAEESAQVVAAPLMWTPIHELRFVAETDLTQYAEFRCLLPSDAGLVTNRLTTVAVERALRASLRTEHAIAYGVTSQFDTFRGDPAVMTIRADMPKHRVRDGFEVWEAFGSRSPSEVLGSEITGARIDSVRAATTFGLTPANAGYSLFSAWLNGEGFDNLALLPSAIAQVSDEAVLEAFTFCREHSVLTFYGDRAFLKQRWSDMLVERTLSGGDSPDPNVPADKADGLEPSPSTTSPTPATDSAPPTVPATN